MGKEKNLPVPRAFEARKKKDASGQREREVSN